MNKTHIEFQNENGFTASLCKKNTREIPSPTVVSMADFAKIQKQYKCKFCEKLSSAENSKKDMQKEIWVESCPSEHTNTTAWMYESGKGDVKYIRADLVSQNQGDLINKPSCESDAVFKAIEMLRTSGSLLPTSIQGLHFQHYETVKDAFDKLRDENKRLEKELSIRMGYDNDDCTRYIVYKSNVYNPKFFEIVKKGGA